jgi:hypothetical protein
MFWKLLLLEKDKFAGRLFLWIEFGILALIVVIIDMFGYLLLNVPHIQKQPLLHQIVWPQALVHGIQMGSLGNMLLVIAIAVVTAQEYTWRTFHLWLSRGVSRMSLLAAKSSIIIVLTVLIVLTASIVGAIVTGILTLTLQGSLPFAHITIQTLVLSFLATDLGLLPYAALTFMLTIIFRNVVASIGIGLAFLLFIENVLSLTLSGINQLTETIANYLPGQLNTSLSDAIQGIAPASHTSPTPLIACISLIAYTGLFAGIGIWTFRHQNFTD